MTIIIRKSSVIFITDYFSAILPCFFIYRIITKLYSALSIREDLPFCLYICTGRLCGIGFILRNLIIRILADYGACLCFLSFCIIRIINCFRDSIFIPISTCFSCGC